MRQSEAVPDLSGGWESELLPSTSCLVSSPEFLEALASVASPPHSPLTLSCHEEVGEARVLKGGADHQGVGCICVCRSGVCVCIDVCSCGVCVGVVCVCV